MAMQVNQEHARLTKERPVTKQLFSSVEAKNKLLRFPLATRKQKPTKIKKRKQERENERGGGRERMRKKGVVVAWGISSWLLLKCRR